MLKWDKRFLRLAREVASWSKDEAHQVGAVIVDRHNHIISTGYNGPPAGIDILENKDVQTIHAEVNAILQANRDIRFCTIYVYPFLPCATCASIITQSGLGFVITLDQEISEKWNPHITEKIFEDAHVNFKKYSRLSELD